MIKCKCSVFVQILGSGFTIDIFRVHVSCEVGIGSAKQISVFLSVLAITAIYLLFSATDTCCYEKSQFSHEAGVFSWLIFKTPVPLNIMQNKQVHGELSYLQSLIWQTHTSSNCCKLLKNNKTNNIDSVVNLAVCSFCLIQLGLLLANCYLKDYSEKSLN